MWQRHISYIGKERRDEKLIHNYAAGAFKLTYLFSPQDNPKCYIILISFSHRRYTIWRVGTDICLQSANKNP